MFAGDDSTFDVACQAGWPPALNHQTCLTCLSRAGPRRGDTPTYRRAPVQWRAMARQPASVRLLAVRLSSFRNSAIYLIARHSAWSWSTRRPASGAGEWVRGNRSGRKGRSVGRSHTLIDGDIYAALHPCCPSPSRDADRPSRGPNGQSRADHPEPGRHSRLRLTAVPVSPSVGLQTIFP
jgi:hypothetical protein